MVGAGSAGSKAVVRPLHAGGTAQAPHHGTEGGGIAKLKVETSGAESGHPSDQGGSGCGEGRGRGYEKPQRLLLGAQADDDVPAWRYSRAGGNPAQPGAAEATNIQAAVTGIRRRLRRQRRAEEIGSFAPRSLGVEQRPSQADEEGAGGEPGSEL